MKGQLLSSDELAKNEERQYLKISQNSSQPLQDRFEKANINFQGIQKNTFHQLMQKTKGFSRAILIRLATIAKKGRDELSLKRYLNIIQNKHLYIESNSIYNKAIDQFKSLFLAQVECIWQQFNQQQRREYEQFGKQNFRNAKQFEEELRVGEQKFSGLQMLKIDILCLAFHFNNHYFAGSVGNKKPLLPYDLLQKIFGYNKDYIAKMAQIFKQSQRDIQVYYKQQFHQYYEFLYFIRLSYKFINYSKRNGKEALDNISLAYIQFNKNQGQAQYSGYGKFKFCQIVFEQILFMLKQSKDARKFKIKTQNIEDKKKLLKISNQLEIPLGFLLKMDKIDQNSNKQQYLAKFQQNLYKCQWVFLKGPYSLIEGINTAFQNKIACSAFYWAKNRQRLLLILFKLAIGRFNLLPNIFKMHQKLDPKIFIYVHRFQYSLKQTQKSYQNENIKQQQFQDSKCCLVVLVANQQILAYSTCRSVLTSDCYISVIKLCLKQKVIQDLKPFNLVLYGFDFQNPIDWQAVTQFQIYLNKISDSRIYILNDPELFQPHFLVDAFIRCFLSQLNLNKENFYEYFQVCMNKLLKGIDFFVKKTNQQYFAYFSKVMSLEFGLKDVWKCFKKERGNKYNALIFDGSDNEEVCPKDFRMLLKEEIPNQQWFVSIQYCQASFHKFIEFKEKENWRKIQSFEELSRTDFFDLLKRKNLREIEIKRLLRDVARCLIDYQILFKELIDKQQGLNQFIDKNQIVSFLMSFYQNQNKNIDQVYSRSQREALINQFAKKYDKQIKVTYFSKKSKKSEVPVKIQHFQQ